ncbi:hypothetical protein [Mongoliimonas terrestris]|uniref:hypothetical protein n=1 Tax=Mongoliimonas terrestris TaxID=1709001 RepID=UPI00094971F5|nr:hypothetical protein [Mongoliimonas terrestris]
MDTAARLQPALRPTPAGPSETADAYAYLPRTALRAMLAMGGQQKGPPAAGLVATAAARPEILAEVVGALTDQDPDVRRHAARVIDALVRAGQRVLEPHAGRIRALFMSHDDAHVQAALAAAVSGRRWSDAEIPAIADRLMVLRAGPSAAVRNAALDALFRLSRRSTAVAALYAAEWEKANVGTASEKARARVLAKAAAAPPPMGRRSTDHVVQIARRRQPAA